MMLAPIVAADALSVPPVTVTVRELDSVRIAILLKSEPLTAAEWAYVEEGEAHD